MAFNTNCVPGCTIDGLGGPMCSCTQPGSYLSSTTYQYSLVYAWNVSFFSGGIVGNASKSVTSNLTYVRALRGGS